MSGFCVFASSLSLLIRAPNRARCQAEILLSALCKFPEPALALGVSHAHKHAGEKKSGDIGAFRQSMRQGLHRFLELRETSTHDAGNGRLQPKQIFDLRLRRYPHAIKTKDNFGGKGRLKFAKLWERRCIDLFEKRFCRAPCRRLVLNGGRHDDLQQA